MNKEKPYLRLEPLKVDDSPIIYELFHNPEVRACYTDQAINTKEDSMDFVIRITSKGCWTWKIIDPHTKNRIIGICSLHHLDMVHKTIQIGATLFPQFWGQGYMSWAFVKLFEIVSQRFDVNSVIGKTQVTNLRAIRMAKGIGFSFQSLRKNTVVLVKNLNNTN